MNIYRVTIAGYYPHGDGALCRAEIWPEHEAPDARSALAMTLDELDLERDEVWVLEGAACAAGVCERDLAVLSGGAVHVSEEPHQGFVIEAIEAFPLFYPHELN